MFIKLYVNKPVSTFTLQMSIKLYVNKPVSTFTLQMSIKLYVNKPVSTFTLQMPIKGQLLKRRDVTPLTKFCQKQLFQSIDHNRFGLHIWIDVNMDIVIFYLTTTTSIPKY